VLSLVVAIKADSNESVMNSPWSSEPSRPSTNHAIAKDSQSTLPASTTGPGTEGVHNISEAVEIGTDKNDMTHQAKAKLEQEVEEGSAFVAMAMDPDDDQLVDVLDAIKDGGQQGWNKGRTS